MRQGLMSRYGGHAITNGQWKSSASHLPQDQSLDNMLDNYATEIIPNHFFISSYDAIPEWMGNYKLLSFPKPVKAGTINHYFDELPQNCFPVTTDIYITHHRWKNVYAVFIKTHKDELKWVLDNYLECYVYTLMVFIRSKIEGEEQSLNLRPDYLEKILIILFYKMGLNYEGYLKSFTPSKTHLGKKISQKFVDRIVTILDNVDSDEALTELLKQYN